MLYVKKYVPDIAFHNISHVDKTVLAAGEIVINVPLMNGPMRTHHLITCLLVKKPRKLIWEIKMLRKMGPTSCSTC